MNNPTRLIWSTWPPRCVWSGVFFFFGSLNLKGRPFISHFVISNWNRMKLSCLTYFHIFCSVSSCLVMFQRCFSCALRQHLEKPLGAEVGAHFARCLAMLSDSSLRQQRGLVEKTAQVSENVMLPTLKVNPKDYMTILLLLLATFFKVYKFLRLQQILQMIDKSTNRYLILDLSTSGWMSGSHPRLFQRRPSGSVVSKGSLPKAGADKSPDVSWKSFWRFFLVLAHHQFVDYLNKASFMKISGDHRRKPASSRLWPHFPLHLRQKDWNVPWVKVTSAWKNKRDMWNLYGKFLQHLFSVCSSVGRESHNSTCLVDVHILHFGMT